MAFLQIFIKLIQRAPGLFSGRCVSTNGKLVPLRTHINAKLLLDTCQILIELTVKRTGETVIIKGEDDMGHV